MEREVGGGIGMGNTCKSMAVSFQCMTKSTTNKKKKKKRMMKSYQLENFLKLRKKIYSSVVEKTHILGDMTISFKFLSH